MISLLLRNLFFTILQPGIVAGLIPYLIIEDAEDTIQIQWSFLNVLGIVIFILGLIILLKCILQFAFEGKGTLSPADPTKSFVIKGLYKYSRNPMYIGVMLILIGEFIYFQLTTLLLYSILIFIAFNLFIVVVEEPRLKRDFNDEYADYCRKVRRWI